MEQYNNQNPVQQVAQQGVPQSAPKNIYNPNFAQGAYSGAPNFTPPPMSYTPLRTMQGPPEAKPTFNIRDFIFAIITAIMGFAIFKLFFTSGAYLAFGEIFVSGYYHIIILLFGIMSIIYIGKKPKAGQWVIFVTAAIFCIVPFLSSTLVTRFLSWVYAALLMIYFAYTFSWGAEILGRGFVKNFFASLFAAPFGNFTAEFKSLAVPVKYRKSKSRTVLYILLGLLASIPAVLIVTALLSSADDNFDKVTGQILAAIGDNFFSNIMILAVSIPLTCLLFGAMVNGKKRKRTLAEYNGSAEVIPAAAVCAAVAPLLVIYLLFFICQLPYFLSAFGGTLPEGYSYSEFARKGFFELCFVAFINVCTIIGMSLFAKRKEGRKSHPAVKTFSVILCVMTLILIASALSKMLLYIDEYGLTALRVYTSWFMILMALTVIVEIIRQLFPSAPAVKLHFAVFSICLAVLCFADVDRVIAKTNVDMYLSGKGDIETVYYLAGLSESAATEVARLPEDNFARQTYFGVLSDAKDSPLYFHISLPAIKAESIQN